MGECDDLEEAVLRIVARLLLLLMLLPTAASAQALYSARGSDVISIDPVSGNNLEAGVVRLATVHLRSGTTSSLLLTGVAGLVLEYDAASGLLVALSSTDVVTVHPTTGVTTILGPKPLFGVFGGVHTYDPVGRRLFYAGLNGVDLTARIAVFDLDTNTEYQVPVPGLFGFIEYVTSGQILGARGSDIISIDPATGNAVVLGPRPLAGVAQGLSTFDQRNRRLYYVGSSFGPQHVVTVHAESGAATAVEVPGIFGFLEYDAGAVAIPALGTMGLIFAAAALAIAGVLRAMG